MAHSIPELLALDAHRIKRDLTWEKLAADTRRAGHPIPARTLHFVCTNRANTPVERTLYKIREYLKARHIGYRTERAIREAKAIANGGRA